MDFAAKWVQLAGRVALGAIFLVSALDKLANWNGTVAFAASKGVPEVLLAAATALELLGALSLPTGFKAHWGVVALIVFLVPVTPVFLDFWAAQGTPQQQQLTHFLKNVAIGGGLFVEFVAGPGAVSVDSRLANTAAGERRARKRVSVPLGSPQPGDGR